MDLLNAYGSRCFMSEVINACLNTKTEFFVAPYQATSQLVYFFQEKMVSCVAGSLMSLLYEEKKQSQSKDPMQLNQVIVELDTENGLFKFVELSDLLTAFAPRTKQKHEVIDLLLSYGALFDFSIVANPSLEAFAHTVSQMS